MAFSQKLAIRFNQLQLFLDQKLSGINQKTLQIGFKFTTKDLSNFNKR